MDKKITIPVVTQVAKAKSINGINPQNTIDLFSTITDAFSKGLIEFSDVSGKSFTFHTGSTFIPGGGEGEPDVEITYGGELNFTGPQDKSPVMEYTIQSVVQEAGGDKPQLFAADTTTMRMQDDEIFFSYSGMVGEGELTPFSTDMEFQKNTIEITGDSPNFLGLTYSGDYSENFTNRSLVDKAYVDNAVPNIIQLTTDPSSKPSGIGQFHINTATGIAWIATGTSATGDWKQITN
jgi:hypothetical protein